MQCALVYINAATVGLLKMLYNSWSDWVAFKIQSDSPVYIIYVLIGNQAWSGFQSYCICNILRGHFNSLYFIFSLYLTSDIKFQPVGPE